MAAGAVAIAVLALGRVVDIAVPEYSDTRPFVRTARVGERVDLRYAAVTVDDIRTARSVTAGSRRVPTSGRWLVVMVTVVARGRPLDDPGVRLQDARGRWFTPDVRTDYAWESAPTGVPWRVEIPFELPEDALAGATFVLTGGALDERRDDAAEVDLGIGPDDIPRLWQAPGVTDIRPPSIGAA